MSWVKKHVSNHKELCLEYLATKRKYNELAKAVKASYDEYPVRRGCILCKKMHVVPRKVRGFICEECNINLDRS